MYKFLGYVIKNELGDCVQFVKTKEECTQICQQNNIPTDRMSQVVEWVNTKVEDLPVK